MKDYDFCPICQGLREAGGDDGCICDDEWYDEDRADEERHDGRNA